MITGDDFALQAMSEKYTGVPYSKFDCQAYVEQVLRDCGVRKPDGSVYNWKGSNDMWRHALSWKGTKEECRDRFGEIPLGAWVFIVKHDGGEVERGYHDNEGNASHVGILCRRDNNPVRDSTRTKTRDGVGYRSLDSFNMVGLPTMILYPETHGTPGTDDPILRAVAVIRSEDSTDSEYLEAIKTLTKYLRGI